MRLMPILVLLALMPASPAALAQTTIPKTDLELKASYAPVVKDAAPAVVNIYTKRVVTQRMRSVFDDPFMRDFFGRSPGLNRQRVESSLGSGVIVDPKGIIVTNNHVVENAGEIKVVLADRREFEAEVLLTDAQTDLAILRVETNSDLPFIDFADSDRAEVGDIVLAIGNPFGVGQTVTSGIVSALSRTAASISDYQFFIQTDAAINPGNSGGALVDVNGRLLGVNTAIYSRSGGSNGIGFAIPGNLVRQVVESAAGGERMVRRPWLGLQGTSVDSKVASALGLDRPVGVIVGDIYPKSPGDRAGVREGDVIVAIGDQDIFDAEALRYRPATRRAGDRIDLKLLRDGKQKTVSVKLDYPPEDPPRNETILDGQHPLSGVTIANLSPALAEELGRNPMGSGVVITAVDDTSLGRRYGIQPNLALVQVNGVAIKDVKDVLRAVNTNSRVFVMQLADQNGRVSTLRVGR
ncbi:Do family serine endopeptidase [Parvularcula sp. LCG005]|uniref:Do family serine endopeptidase n=1 Tax=Parvularcula sp. LCG005 TaxID=3078805 RepID=UPI00294336D6|nr:Do family serine endopeptidase [Parvularcula sp. LCG005]WOI54495.1 Do family serine endopeptidase [Parvularcula sp. LCG005]